MSNVQGRGREYRISKFEYEGEGKRKYRISKRIATFTWKLEISTFCNGHSAGGGGLHFWKSNRVSRDKPSPQIRDAPPRNSMKADQ